LNKTEKSELVDSIREKFERADATFLTEYRSVKADVMSDFRKDLRDASVEFKVVRNTLARRAASGTAGEHLSEHFNGPVALVFSYGDAAVAAKKLTEFAKDNPGLKFRAGVLGGDPIGIDEIKGLAALPSRDVLLGKLLGSISSPMLGIVGVLSGLPRSLVYTLNAIKEVKAQQQ
jgi:large subunit ribosomal protein L10